MYAPFDVNSLEVAAPPPDPRNQRDASGIWSAISGERYISVMAAVLASVIAVLRTLAGTMSGYVFQKKIGERAELVAQHERLRHERMLASSAFAGAVMDMRRVQYDKWHRRHESPTRTDPEDVRNESYRLRSAAGARTTGSGSPAPIPASTNWRSWPLAKPRTWTKRQMNPTFGSVAKQRGHASTSSSQRPQSSSRAPCRCCHRQSRRLGSRLGQRNGSPDVDAPSRLDRCAAGILVGFTGAPLTMG